MLVRVIVIVLLSADNQHAARMPYHSKRQYSHKILPAHRDRVFDYDYAHRFAEHEHEQPVPLDPRAP